MSIYFIVTRYFTTTQQTVQILNSLRFLVLCVLICATVFVYNRFYLSCKVVITVGHGTRQKQLFRSAAEWPRCLNRLTPNDPYRTAPLTSKRCILYIYSTNIDTEYFKHGPYSPFFSLQNAVCFIMLTCLVPVLFTFYIQDVIKFKKIIPASKG